MKFQWICAGLLAAALAAAPRSVPQSGEGGQSHAKSMSAQEQTRRFLEMPLDFEFNSGQAPAGYAFVAHETIVCARHLVIGARVIAASAGNRRKRKSETGDRCRSSRNGRLSKLRLHLLGAAKDSRITSFDPQPGHSNYFIGNDPAKWQTSIARFNRVKIAEAYAAMDLIFYGNQRQLVYDFAIAPGADTSRIRILAAGAQSVTHDAKGNAILHTSAGDVQLKHSLFLPGSRRPAQAGRKRISNYFGQRIEDCGGQL
jgi:hypothetical protein